MTRDDPEKPKFSGFVYPKGLASRIIEDAKQRGPMCSDGCPAAGTGHLHINGRPVEDVTGRFLDEKEKPE